MPTVDDEGVFMPTNGTASTPPGGHTPDLTALRDALFAMEGKLGRTRHFIMAMRWAVAQFRETYGVDRVFCDAYETIADEAQDNANFAFRAWEKAIDLLPPEKGAD